MPAEFGKDVKFGEVVTSAEIYHVLPLLEGDTDTALGIPE